VTNPDIFTTATNGTPWDRRAEKQSGELFFAPQVRLGTA
jgi:hypothetical protein